MKKALSVIMSVIIIILCSSCSGLKSREHLSDDYSIATVDSATEVETEPSKIKSVETPTASAQTLRKGEKLELDFDFDAEESIEDEDVKVVIKDESVVELDSIKIHNFLDYFEVTVSALNYGNTTIQVTSANGVVKSKEIPITVPKELENVEISGESSIKLSVGESRSVSMTLKPNDLTEKEVTLLTDEDDVLEIKDIQFKSEKESTTLTFTVLAIKTHYSSININICNAFSEPLATINVTVEEEKTEPPTTKAPAKPAESSSSKTDSPAVYSDDNNNDAGDNGGSTNTYILNTNTKKFHYPSCSSVNKMSEKNKQEYTGSRDEVIAMGYDPCQRCNP